MPSASTPATPDSSDLEEVRSLFLRQAAAETAHDIEAMGALLASPLPGQADPVNFIARAYRFWGREAVLEHFRTVFTGIWRFEPDMEAIRVTLLGPDTAHIFAPTQITVGVEGQPSTTFEFLVNEFAIRTAAGWRISTIIPVPTK